MAGYSGGRKLIMPGIAGFETIQNWHCPRFLESSMSAAGVVDGNPVHLESMAIAKMCPPHIILDVTLDASSRITGIFAGDLEKAWVKGVTFAAAHVREEIPEKADIVVTTCAGSPLDATFYQAVKGMVGAIPAVKRGGTIIIAAECAEGLGSSDFAELLLNTTDLDAFVEHISMPGVFLSEEWEVEELAKAVKHANITCFTNGIKPETLAQCFVTPATSVEEAVANALTRHGGDATIIAIPKGPYVIPQCSDS
jgi:nickel-dependent lactate racemase